MKFILFLSILSSFTSFCQSISDKDIDLRHFNNQLLQTHINYFINHTRDSLGLPPLTYDQVLFQAAQLQSNYCIKVNKLSHFQKKNKFHNLRSRVTYYNGVHQKIGENIANIKLSKDRGIITYNYLAKTFVNNWIRSSGHFKNLKRY